MKIHVNSRLAKIVLPKGYVAFTLGENIYVKDSYASQGLVLHEYQHVLQYRKLGWKFLPVYIWYSIKYGYFKNPLEVEAIEFTYGRLHNYSVEENEILISQALRD